MDPELVVLPPLILHAFVAVLVLVLMLVLVLVLALVIVLVIGACQMSMIRTMGVVWSCSVIGIACIVHSCFYTDRVMTLRHWLWLELLSRRQV